MSQPTVTIFGHVCIDKNTIDGINVETWGSPAQYMAKYYLKNLGLRGHIVTSYGQDFLPYVKGLDFTENPNHHPTLIYQNIIRNGQRTQYCHNSDTSLPVPLSKDIIDLIKKTDILIIAPQIANYSASYIDDIMKFAKNDCIKALLPQGYMRQVDPDGKVQKRRFTEADAILPFFDAVIASDEDYDDILNLAKRWAEYKPNSSIVITGAEKGATLFHNGSSLNVPTKPIPASDIKNPVGCGDIFSAQFIIGLYNKLKPADAVAQANKATAQALISEPLS